MYIMLHIRQWVAAGPSHRALGLVKYYLKDGKIWLIIIIADYLAQLKSFNLYTNMDTCLHLRQYFRAITVTLPFYFREAYTYFAHHHLFLLHHYLLVYPLLNHKL